MLQRSHYLNKTRKAIGFFGFSQSKRCASLFPEAENGTGKPGRHRQRVGDVASLLGRIIHATFVFFIACTVLVTSPLQAAPFAAIVMDARTGEVLFEDNADTRLHPASLTKMMTLYIAFQEIEAGRLSLDTKITVSKFAASQPPSRLGLKPGQKIALRYLIRAAAIKSANDAAQAIGDHIGGDHVEFAKRMTRTARQLGMTSTTFRNASGLTAEGHLSTARDMNILGRHLFYDFPQYYNIFSRRTTDAGVAQVTNTNSRFLDSYEGADGLKTGYTSAAGFNLTASAVRGNKRIIATVFGGTSTANRNAKMKELMDIGFAAAKNRVKEQPPVAPAVLPDDALVASATHPIDQLDAEGGAGKTIRVSGEVKVSPRPRPRPEQPAVPDEVAIAMAEGIEGALAQATADPAPEGTLDFQADAMAAAEAVPAAVPVSEAVAQDTPPVAEVAEVVVATSGAGQSPDGTLDAQAEELTIAEGQDGPEGALTEVDLALADIKPMPRPDHVPEAGSDAAESSPAVDTMLALDETPAVPDQRFEAEAEVVVTAAAPEETNPLPEITAVETVASAAVAAPLPPAAVATASAAPARKAPIFDSVQPAEPEPEIVQEVVVMSTSGGRHFGVHVGDYASRYDAERALLKTALAESATLNESLRKTMQAGSSWRASFMGLTEEQAELACRRLRARAVPCETVGG